MPITELDTDPVYSEDTAIYLSNADRRIVYGFRAALEMLDIPLPKIANRKPAGNKRISAVLADFHADNPAEAVKDRQRNLEARSAASVANRKARKNNA